MNPRSMTPGGLRCSQVALLLSRFLDGELAGEEMECVSRHLECCAGCRGSLAEEETLLSATVTQLIDIEPPSSFRVASLVSVRRGPRISLAGIAAAAGIVLSLALFLANESTPKPPAPPIARGNPTVEADDVGESAQPESTLDTERHPETLPDAVLATNESHDGAIVDREPDGPAIALDVSDTEVRDGEQPAAMQRGDLDGDGMRTLLDLQLLARLIHADADHGEALRGVACPAAGDFDDDGDLTPSDYSIAASSWVTEAEPELIVYDPALSQLACSHTPYCP